MLTPDWDLNMNLNLKCLYFCYTFLLRRSVKLHGARRPYILAICHILLCVQCMYNAQGSYGAVCRYSCVAHHSPGINIVRRMLMVLLYCVIIYILIVTATKRKTVKSNWDKTKLKKMLDKYACIKRGNHRAKPGKEKSCWRQLRSFDRIVWGT